MPPPAITPVGLNTAVQAGDLMEFSVYCYCVDQLSVNRYHYYADTPIGTAVSFDAVASFLSPLFAPPYRVLLSSAAFFLGTSLRNVFPLTRRTLYRWTKNRLAGTAGPNPLPRQVCGMFTKVSNMPRQGGRGRAYIPFPDGLQQDIPNDRPNAGYMVNLGTLAGVVKTQQNVIVGASSVLLRPVIYKIGNPASSNVVGDCTARQAWATHRSRGDYGKVNAIPNALQ